MQSKLKGIDITKYEESGKENGGSGCYGSFPSWGPLNCLLSPQLPQASSRGYRWFLAMITVSKNL